MARTRGETPAEKCAALRRAAPRRAARGLVTSRDTGAAFLEGWRAAVGLLRTERWGGGEGGGHAHDRVYSCGFARPLELVSMITDIAIMI